VLCIKRNLNTKMKIEDLRQSGKASLYLWRDTNYVVLKAKVVKGILREPHQ
jgi:hypothetical protein